MLLWGKVYDACVQSCMLHEVRHGHWKQKTEYPTVQQSAMNYAVPESMFGKLEAAQNKALHIITGQYQTTLLDALGQDAKMVSYLTSHCRDGYQTASVWSAKCDLYKAVQSTAGDHRPWHARPAHLPSCAGASNKSQKCPLNFTNSWVDCHRLKKTPTVCAHESNAITSLLQTDDWAVIWTPVLSLLEKLL